MSDHEMCGVRLGDLYRDKDGFLWEVYALCDQPQAYVRRIADGVGSEREHYVIGSLNWQSRWASGPIREVGT